MDANKPEVDPVEAVIPEVVKEPINKFVEGSSYQFNKFTRLLMRNERFVLQLRDMEDGEWEDRFHYDWFGDALRGYMLYELQLFSGTNLGAEMPKLLSAVEDIGSSIKKMETEFTYGPMDPVERNAEIDKILNQPEDDQS